ncbi:uncharacterized protein LOC109593907 [Aethina tumida]|uniref:uncharacterized protein LOC109593907 n=1 Tax=Aethina tumida TaxID=116153 RepID=UPI002148110E|nr:uncharacterized protein LOC109593907 [Aethina tumida]
MDNTTVFTPLKNHYKITQQLTPTADFLEAANATISVIGSLGMCFLTMVHTMKKNIKTLTEHFLIDPKKYEFLEDMISLAIENEQIAVTEAMLWLARELGCIWKFLELIIEEPEEEDTGPLLQAAYERYIAIYHGWISSNLINVLSKNCPSRKKLLHIFALRKDHLETNVLIDMRLYVDQLGAMVEKFRQFIDWDSVDDVFDY